MDFETRISLYKRVKILEKQLNEFYIQKNYVRLQVCSRDASTILCEAVVSPAYNWGCSQWTPLSPHTNDSLIR